MDNITVRTFWISINAYICNQNHRIGYSLISKVSKTVLSGRFNPVFSYLFYISLMRKWWKAAHCALSQTYIHMHMCSGLNCYSRKPFTPLVSLGCVSPRAVTHGVTSVEFLLYQSSSIPAVHRHPLRWGRDVPPQWASLDLGCDKPFTCLLFLVFKVCPLLVSPSAGECLHTSPPVKPLHHPCLFSILNWVKYCAHM